jgi:hypothetical protein
VRVRPAIALTALLLVGCTAAPAPVDTMAPMVTETPTADAVDPSLANDALFVIAATTTSASGEAVELTMTGHASQPVDARPEVKQSYVEQCTALGGGVVMNAGGGLDDASLAAVGSSLMVIDTTSVPAATTLVGGVELLLGNPFYTVVAAGDGLATPMRTPATAATRSTRPAASARSRAMRQATRLPTLPSGAAGATDSSSPLARPRCSRTA